MLVVIHGTVQIHGFKTMIVVFVIDTSPSMSQRLVGSKIQGMSRLDLAKMAVESLTKGLNKRISEHNNQLHQLPQSTQQSMHNIGLGYCHQDQFLLLSTSRQGNDQLSTAACGAGGRLLAGFGDYLHQSLENTGDYNNSHQSRQQGSFEKELKKLQATVWHREFEVSSVAHPQTTPFPEDGGGAAGLNAALSHGLALMSRYRLQNRNTENFGMGRLTSPSMLAPNGGGNAMNALQPACLVLITDGECLRKSPSEGGGSLQLQLSNLPLREFYHEPFRWDQRVFTLCVGGQEGANSSQYLHTSLRAFCEVTGGFHMMLRSTTGLSYLTDSIIKNISPQRPKDLPIPDPMRATGDPPSAAKDSVVPKGCFVNGGPICCFQALEAGPNGEASLPHRAMLLYVPFQDHDTTSKGSTIFHPPIWCLPESYFPGKKLDTLPPRLAQPLLTYSKNYMVVGSNTFDPHFVIKCLNHLELVVQQNRQKIPLPTQPGQQTSKACYLHRDNYICEWVSDDGKVGHPPKSLGMAYFPIVVRGAGRALVEGEEQMLGIGILHIPQGSTQLNGARLSTLTLLPPEPHILLPILIKAAEAEARAIKKSTDPKAARNVILDEGWRNEFRAYMFRIPPYYHTALKRCLRPILPASAHTLLNADAVEPLPSQCFSKMCSQKIRNGELMAQSSNERLERQETDLMRRGVPSMEARHLQVLETGKVGYGQYDSRVTISSYLAALRNLPPPWHVGIATKKSNESEKIQETTSEMSSAALNQDGIQTAADVLGDLPADCLIPYYESRRRWVFGGSGLATRGVHVDGVNNDGSNVQKINSKHSIDDVPLLALADIGVSTLNQTTTVKMGDYRERLLWSRAPIVGYGSGVASTTAADGSPLWSVDDDVLPLSFFDNKTGEFNDSVQARVRTRLTVHFGNPFKDRRGDSLVPDVYIKHCPPLRRRGDSLGGESNVRTPPGSPTHDNFSSGMEGEGEAVFAPLRKSSCTPDLNVEEAKKRAAEKITETEPDEKRQKSEIIELSSAQLLSSPEKRPFPPKSDAVKPPPPKPSAPPPRTSALLPKTKVAAPPKPPPAPPRTPLPSAPKTPVPKPPTERRASINAERPPPPKPAGQTARPATATKLSIAPPSVVQQRPPPPKPKVSLAKTEQQFPSFGLATAVQSPDNKPEVDLPVGWICAWSKSQKRWYFFDQRTNTSVWQWPPPGGIPE